jgi:hypothetical protein
MGRRACSASWARAAVVVGVAIALVGCPGPGAPVVTIDVEGRVVGLYDLPLAGVVVRSGAAVTVTDAAGRFSLAEVTTPYDLVLSKAEDGGWVHVFEGLTDAAPRLAPDRLGLTSLAPFARATLRGTVALGFPLPTDRRVIVCVEGLDAIVFGCDRVETGGTAYELTAYWAPGPPVAVRVHALAVDLAAGLPVAYPGYGVFATTLEAGVPATLDVTYPQNPTTSTLTATIIPAGGATLESVVASVRLGEHLTMEIYQGSPPGGALALTVPAIGSGYEVGAASRSQTELGFAWRARAATAFGEIRLAASPQLLAPADGTLGATLATAFSATVNPAGPMTFQWAPETTGVRFAVTTQRTSVTLPDPAESGFAWPGGAEYGWLAYAQGVASVDAAASTGLVRFYGAVRPGGPGWGSDGELTLHASRIVGWGP